MDRHRASAGNPKASDLEEEILPGEASPDGSSLVAEISEKSDTGLSEADNNEQDEELDFVFDFDKALSLQDDSILEPLTPEEVDPSWVEPNYLDNSWFRENCLFCAVCNTKHLHCLDAMTCFNLHRESVLQCPLCFWLIPGDKNDKQGLFKHYQTYHHPHSSLTLKCPYCSESILFENVEKHVHSTHFPVNAPRNVPEVIQFFQDTPTDHFVDAEQFLSEMCVHAQLVIEPTGEYTRVRNYVVNSSRTRGNVGTVQLLQVVQLSRKPVPGTSAGARATSQGILHGSDNRKMLWHGTRPEKIKAILGQGLLGFGRGIYFADRIIKSAEYCGVNPQPEMGKVGYVFLCEVQLGRVYPASMTSVYEWPPYLIENGEVVHCDSVMCAGLNIPDPEGDLVTDGVIWPIGETVRNTGLAAERFPFQYSEYIVQDPSQVTIKYLVKVRITRPGENGDDKE